jgi:hypothetical protein
MPKGELWETQRIIAGCEESRFATQSLVSQWSTLLSQTVA